MCPENENRRIYIFQYDILNGAFLLVLMVYFKHQSEEVRVHGILKKKKYIAHGWATVAGVGVGQVGHRGKFVHDVYVATIRR